MDYQDSTKLDLLWKQLLFRGMTSAQKAYFEEAVLGSSFPVSPSDVWNQDDLIPENPATPSAAVEEQTNVVLTPAPSVGDNRAFVATSTYGDLSSRLADWIPPRYGQGYNVKLYEDDGTFDEIGNPSGGLGRRIYNPDALHWIFLGSGLLICEYNPLSINKTLPLHVAGYRYIGTKGVGGAGGGGDDLNTTFVQAAPSYTWTVTHGLNKRPSVTVLGKVNGVGDTKIIEPDTLVYNTTNYLTLTFLDQISGTAYLN